MIDTSRFSQVNLIIQSPQDWHTGTMLPFTQIEGTVSSFRSYPLVSYTRLAFAAHRKLTV